MTTPTTTRARTLAESYRDAAALGMERCRMRRAAIVRLAMTLGIWSEFQRACEEIGA